MTEQKPQRKGRDFSIGFFGSILLSLPSIIILFTKEHPGLLIGAVVILIIAATAAFLRKQKMIGIGILSGIVAIPALFVGSCFGYVLFDGGF